MKVLAMIMENRIEENMVVYIRGMLLDLHAPKDGIYRIRQNGLNCLRMLVDLILLGKC